MTTELNQLLQAWTADEVQVWIIGDRVRALAGDRRAPVGCPYTGASIRLP